MQLYYLSNKSMNVVVTHI